MKTLRFLIVLSGCIALPFSSADARTAPEIKPPAIVFIIRHAEKPPAGDKSPDLTPVGFHRAELLPSLFLPAPHSSRASRLPRPDVLFATAESKHSNRPVETITPLSTALHMPILHDFEDHETALIAKEVLSGRYAGKVVLICWHHGEIPHLAQALGVSGAPSKWQDDVFDQVWKVEWTSGQARLTTLPEALLPGDSTQ